MLCSSAVRRIVDRLATSACAILRPLVSVARYAAAGKVLGSSIDSLLRIADHHDLGDTRVVREIVRLRESIRRNDTIATQRPHRSDVAVGEEPSSS